MGYLQNIGRALLGKPGLRAESSYHAAATTRRLATWQPSHEHVNSLLSGSGDLIRARARERIRNDGLAAGGIDEWVSEAIGTGIRPIPQHPDKATRLKLKELWKAFTDESDVTGNLSVYGQQRLAFRGALEGGDSFTRLRWRRPTDGLAVPLQLQVLESEHVPLTMNETRGKNRIRTGIEIDPIDRRAAYHVYVDHPGDSTVQSPRGLKKRRVPAKNVLHEYYVRRPGQIRGEPHIVRALIKLHELSLYDEAELERKKLAAFIAGFISPPANEDIILPEDSSIAETGETADDNEAFARIEPGSFPVVPVDGDITIAQAADVGGSYEPFMRQQLRFIARAMNLSYEQLTGDLSGVNYSSIRQGVVKFRRHARTIQADMIIHQWSRRVWIAFIDACVLAGHFTAAEVAAQPFAFYRVTWRPPKWEWVDPLKDVQADKLEVDELFASRSEKVAERGGDPEELDEEIAADQERAKALGIKTEAAALVVPNTEKQEAEADEATNEAD